MEDIHLVTNIEKYFTVDWSVGSTCNFSCSYCPDELHNGSTSWIGINKLQQLLNKIYEHTTLPLHFILSGGEITMDPKIKEKLDLIKSNSGNIITCLSNGSRTLRWWKDYQEIFDVLNLTCHTEEGNAEHMLEVAQLMNKTADVTINVPMKHDDWDTSVNNAITLTKNNNGYPVVLKPLRINFGHIFYPYSDEQLDFMAKYSIFNNYDSNWEQPKSKKFNPRFKIEYKDGKNETIYPASWINENKNRFKGWSCYIGVEKIFIGIDGRISRGSWCKAGGGRGALGNVNNPQSIQFPKDPVECPNDYCVNVTDFKTTKLNYLS